MKTVCIYCGSSPGRDPIYIDSAREMGKILAKQEVTLVYGGGSVGLMGALADSVLESGGKVIGVLPRFLDDKELGHESVTEMIRVNSMHDRKLTMSQISDGFLGMPGGFGTLEELAEILTWVQLGLINKPVGLLNVNHYYDHLIAMLDRMVDERLLKQENRRLLIESEDPAEILDLMRSFKPSVVEKWMQKDQT